jgi:hypothetical protein
VLLFGKWNIRSLYSAGSLMTVLMELSRYRLDLMKVQEVRWEGSDIETAAEYTFSIERGMRTINCIQAFLYIRESYHQG